MTLRTKRIAVHYAVKHRRQRKNSELRITTVAFILTAAALIGICIDMYFKPEIYLSTWRYQLENSIKRGDADAIEYYNRTYTEKGIELYE